MAQRILGPRGGRRRTKRVLAVTTILGLSIFVAVLVTGGTVFAAPSTDASVSDYSQCANDKPPSTSTACPSKWINGILNANNSHYHEDQVTPQRLFVDLPRNGPAAGRTIILKYLDRKGQGGVGNHAYDSLGQWNYTQTTADRCQDVTPANCPGGLESTFTIPSDTTAVADSNGSPGDSTANHELPAANRYMSMFGGTITGISAPIHDNANGSGDDYAQVTVTYSVTSTPAKVELLFGGHLAASAGPRGWGSNVGASFINGGPYHIKLIQLDSSSIGNRDNQIQSSAILPQGTQIQTALHETNSGGTDTGNTQDPTTQTGITVNLPSDGSGSYVQDYATVSPSGSTGTVDFRYYSSLTDCQAATNTSEGGTDAGSGKTLTGDVAKSNVMHFTSIGTIYWRAFFQGSGINLNSSSACSEEILTLHQNTSTATELRETNASGTEVSPSNSGLTISVAVGAYVKDVATVTPNSATGSVAFKYYGSSTDCTDNPTTTGTAVAGGSLSSGSASSSVVQFNSSGTFYWRAFFTGTNGNNDSMSPCNEILTVSKGTPTVTTFPTLRPQDKATLSNITSGGSGSMSLTFTLYGPGNSSCLEDATHTHVFQQTGVSVSGNADYNTNNTTFVLDSSSPTGVYKWKVDFFGNSANNDVAGGCGDETFELGAGGIVNKSS
jgi:hypothetical protein